MKVPCGSFTCHSTLSNVPVCWKSVNTGALARVWIPLVRVTHTWRSDWPSDLAGCASLGTRHPRKLFPGSVSPADLQLTMMWSAATRWRKLRGGALCQCTCPVTNVISVHATERVSLLFNPIPTSLSAHFVGQMDRPPSPGYGFEQ